MRHARPNSRRGESAARRAQGFRAVAVSAMRTGLDGAGAVTTAAAAAPEAQAPGVVIEDTCSATRGQRRRVRSRT